MMEGGSTSASAAETVSLGAGAMLMMILLSVGAESEEEEGDGDGVGVSRWTVRTLGPRGSSVRVRVMGMEGLWYLRRGRWFCQK